MTAVDCPSVTGRPVPPTVFRKVGGSLVVSLVTSALSLLVLGVLTFTDVVPAGVANVIATITGIGPSYALNRRWVWRRTGRSSMRREIGPFWTMCLLALVVSTTTVSAAAGWADARDFGDAVRTGVVLVVNVATFGALWILQYIVLDRFLFRPTPARVEGDGGSATPVVLGALMAIGVATTLVAAPLVGREAVSDPVVSCAFTTTDTWPQGAVAGLTIENHTDRAVTTWMVQIDLNASDVELWNVEELQSKEQRIVVRDQGWNGRVPAGGVSQVAGGIVTGADLGPGDEFECSVVTSSPDPADVTCTFTLTDAWPTGGYGDLTLTHSGDIDVTGWTVRLDTNDGVIWLPGAEVVSRDRRGVTLTDRSWNGHVEAGDSSTPTTGLAIGPGFVIGQSVACTVVGVT